MMIARPKPRAVKGSTPRSMAPSRRWTCQSSGRRSVRVSVISGAAPGRSRKFVRCAAEVNFPYWRICAYLGRKRRMTACITGWAHSRFGKLDGETIESLITRVAADAIADAGLEPRDIDAIYLGTMNAGFVRQEFPASLVLQTDPALRFKPSTHVENACATGSSAIHQGLNL